MEPTKTYYVHGDGVKTETESFNEALACGDLPNMQDNKGGGCKARDWKVYRPNVWPPWTRILKCKQCSRRTPVIMPEWEPKGPPVTIHTLLTPPRLHRT